MMTYPSQAEKDGDKALLEQCRDALNVTRSVLRLDECGLWNLAGKRGRVTTWGDGKGYLLAVYDERLGIDEPVGRRTKRQWTADKKRLSPFATVTQNAELGGVLRFELPITGEQAEIVRDIAGLRVEMELTDEQREERIDRLRRAPSRSRNASDVVGGMDYA